MRLYVSQLSNSQTPFRPLVLSLIYDAFFLGDRKISTKALISSFIRPTDSYKDRLNWASVLQS